MLKIDRYLLAILFLILLVLALLFLIYVDVGLCDKLDKSYEVAQDTLRAVC